MNEIFDVYVLTYRFLQTYARCFSRQVIFTCTARQLAIRAIGSISNFGGPETSKALFSLSLRGIPENEKGTSLFIPISWGHVLPVSFSPFPSAMLAILVSWNLAPLPLFSLSRITVTALNWSIDQRKRRPCLHFSGTVLIRYQVFTVQIHTRCY